MAAEARGSRPPSSDEPAEGASAGALLAAVLKIMRDIFLLAVACGGVVLMLASRLEENRRGSAGLQMRACRCSHVSQVWVCRSAVRRHSSVFRQPGLGNHTSAEKSERGVQPTTTLGFYLRQRHSSTSANRVHDVIMLVMYWGSSHTVEFNSN
jgi:hypothetical protein